MPSHNTLSGDDIVANLERERQAIFNKDISEAEQHHQWSLHKAKIQAYLAADMSPVRTFAQHDRSLARAASHVGLST